MYTDDILETERRLWEAEHPGQDYDEYINALIDEDLDIRE